MLKLIFQFLTFAFQYGAVRVPGNPDRFPPDEDAPAEWVRNHEAVPGLKNFFLEALNVSGRIGSPVSFASCITPD